MIIPKTLKVRVLDNESDSPLGFVTYADETGAIKSEYSWKQWGHKYLGDIENTPMKGFKISGATQRSADWFGSGRTMFYIDHPMGFSIEITTNNFLSLLSLHNIIGGEIMGELVLAWEKRVLSLISVETDLYKKSVAQTNNVNAGVVSMKDLVVGHVYSNREGEESVYLGQQYLVTQVRGCISKIDGVEHVIESCYETRSKKIKEYVVFSQVKYHMFKELTKHTKWYWSATTTKLYDTGKKSTVSLQTAEDAYDGKIKFYMGALRAKHGYVFAINKEKIDLKTILEEGSKEHQRLFHPSKQAYENNCSFFDPSEYAEAIISDVSSKGWICKEKLSVPKHIDTNKRK